MLGGTVSRKSTSCGAISPMPTCEAAVRIEEDLQAALEHSLEPGAAARVAKAWLRYERPELALRAFAQAVERCGGYASTPELAALRPMLAVQ